MGILWTAGDAANLKGHCSLFFIRHHLMLGIHTVSLSITQDVRHHSHQEWYLFFRAEYSSTSPENRIRCKILMVQCLQSCCLDRTQLGETLHIVLPHPATAIYGILKSRSRFMEAMLQNPDMAGAWTAICPSPCWSFRQMLISRHRSCPFFCSGDV